MYYDEQVINGVLCHRGTPNGKWIPFTVEQLTARLQELKAAEQQRALDLPCTCAKFENGSKVFPMRECDGCRKSASQ
jgi:hypothetical protein